MRITFSTLAAAFAVATASLAAAPAMACGVSPCGGYGYGYSGGYAYGGYEQFADPTPVTRQYYYADQGPTYSGPGQFAPTPTYQETAIGWRGYPRYDGGPYANPYDHYTYSYAPAVSGPVVFTPRASYYARPNYRYGYSMRPRIRYGYAPRSYYGHRYAQPRVIYGSHHGYRNAGYGYRHMGYRYGHQRPLRRAY